MTKFKSPFFHKKKMLLPLNSFLLFGARRDNNDHNSTIVKSLTMQCSLAQCNIFPKINLISRKHGISLSKLFWPTMKKNWSSDEEKLLNSRQKAENLQIFEITRAIYSNSERSEQFLVTQCFFNLFLKVSQIHTMNSNF